MTQTITREQPVRSGLEKPLLAAVQPDVDTGNNEDPAVLENGWATTHGVGGRGSVWGLTGLLGTIVGNIGVILLLVCCPVIALFTYEISASFNGCVTDLFLYGRDHGIQSLVALWPKPNLLAWQQFAAFGVLQAALLLLVPGRQFQGPTTPQGNTPVYKANGVQCYLLTLAIFAGTWRLGYFNPGLVYDNFGPLLSTLNISAFAICGLLWLKGHVTPCTTDSGSTGNILYDFFWGMELHPCIGKQFYIKHWTNCRMGMMGWAVLILCFAAKQYQTEGRVADSMIVSVLLMQAYIFKFFLWETGYLSSMDIQHDRAGYMICWGCLVFVPAVYTSPAMYLVNHVNHMGRPLAIANLAVGLICIWINYDADRQRQEFRRSNGKLQIWGKQPQYIKASYVTAVGDTKTSLLLASGWWGVARHFHYVPEVLAAFFWTLPCGFTHFLPYFYVLFLSGILSDRVFRDDARCSSKYNGSWEQYCKLVPYKVIPGVW